MRMVKDSILLAILIAMAPSATHAQVPGILDAVVGEPDLPTQEVSTAELRRILADGSAIAAANNAAEQLRTS